MLYNLQTRVECAFLFFFNASFSNRAERPSLQFATFSRILSSGPPRFLYKPTLKLCLFNSQYTWDNLTLTHFSDVCLLVNSRELCIGNVSLAKQTECLSPPTYTLGKLFFGLTP